jgi:hypothetical protein
VSFRNSERLGRSQDTIARFLTAALSISWMLLQGWRPPRCATATPAEQSGRPGADPSRDLRHYEVPDAGC